MGAEILHSMKLCGPTWSLCGAFRSRGSGFQGNLCSWGSRLRPICYRKNSAEIGHHPDPMGSAFRDGIDRFCFEDLLDGDPNYPSSHCPGLADKGETTLRKGSDPR